LTLFVKRFIRLIQPYAEFLRLPDVKRMVIAAWLSRLPTGMMGLSMLLFLRDALGSFKLAGTAVGAYFIAMAISAPVQGRIIDRQGPQKLLRVTGVAQPLMLLALFMIAYFKMSFPLIVGAAILAGIFPAPITTLTRTIWRQRFTDESARKMAFSVDAVTMELCFTVGPLLVALIITLSNPSVGFLITTTMVFAAFLIFMASPALNYWQQSSAEERHLLGPLTDPQLLLLLVVTFGLATAFGLLEVGYPALATSLSLPALAGVLLAVNSVGSAVGGAVYGVMRINMPLERQFGILLGMMVLPLLLHAWVSQLLLLGIIAFIAGATIAPSIAAQSILVSRLAPQKYATEAFTWSSTFIVSGIGAGMASGGALAETYNATTPFIIAALVMAAMTAMSLLLRRGSVIH
jgi:MFS family permease